MDGNDSKVTKLNVVGVTPGQPNPDIVAMIEEVLADAKRGEIVAIALATVTHDDCTGSLFNVGNSWAKLVGATSYLQHRVTVHGDPAYE